MQNRIESLSMGEGNTPLIRLSKLEKLFKWNGIIYGKAEYQNPTGSFKDRGSIAEITQAIERKKKGVVCASTGNMAASLSAYARRAGILCTVVIPDKTPINKIKQASICGAEFIRMNGAYDECVEVAKKIALDRDYLLCGDYETRRVGQRSIGREIAESKIKFDAFICPVGNGTVGCAIAEGLLEKNQQVSFIGVKGRRLQKAGSAMNVSNPLDSNLTTALITKTKGAFIAVTESELFEGQELLAKTEGIFVETSSASTVVALKKIRRNFKNIVLILTGSGLKEGGGIYGREDY